MTLAPVHSEAPAVFTPAQNEPHSPYQDILSRTGGDMYIGVVGPCRTGKSTFITNVMEQLVLPNLSPSPRLYRLRDELPQSASGRSVMTTQPRFIPGEGAQEVDLGDQIRARVRMVDSVGYLIPGVLSETESRMVQTPWSEDEILFDQAARIGTQRVMADHATLGVVVTTDGTVADFPRDDYIQAEEEAVRDMKASGKPFVLVLNSKVPHTESARALQNALSDKYQVPVALLNVKDMTLSDIQGLLQSVLLTFPLKEIHFDLPAWVEALPRDHWLRDHIQSALRDVAPKVKTMQDKHLIAASLQPSPYLKSPEKVQAVPGEGTITCHLPVQDGLFNRVLTEQCGTDILDDAQLLSLMTQLTQIKREYDRMAGALKAVAQTGYGLVVPAMEDVTLSAPQLMKQGNRYGVRIRASAPTLHLVRSDVETEITPVLGTQEQSEEFIRFLTEEYEQDPARLWDTNFFGKSLRTLVKEGMSGKITQMPMDTREKVQQALSRMLNEGDGGMICILL